MAFTDADLTSATGKLGTLDFSPAELEALASLMSDADDDVSGFGFDPAAPNRGREFMVEIAGLRPRSFDPAASKQVADGIIVIEEGHCY